MNRIKILPEEIAIRIAAGEVIDRPSSVVRELIDNSIDAGADRIAVKITRAGKALVRVSDNGIGMSRDDLLLCIERHATSKIQDLDDLMAIRSLGFRGEALPAIASVSRMTITTKRKDELVGHMIRVSAGKVKDVEEVGVSDGTTVEVKDLFYNVPARKKFLRSDRAETDSIVDVFTRICLGFENIHFLMATENKTILNLPSAGTLEPRISAVLGRRVAEQMVSISKDFPWGSIRAYLAPPDLGRTRSDKLYVYINRRNIKDKLVNKAIAEGYGSRLMKGIFPQAIVFLDIDPSLVDMNVHPAKQEVRFRDPRALFNAVAQTVDEGLGVKIYSSPLVERGVGESHVNEPEQMAWKGWGVKATAALPEEEHTPPGICESVPVLGESLRVIGQLNNTYILCEAEGGLVIVDQHAAHERILYERLIKGIEEEGLEVQNLLLPKTIELGVAEKRLIREKAGLLARLGIEIEDFGGQSILLRSVPALIQGANWEELLGELVTALRQGDHEREVLLGRVVSVMACHGAIRAGYRMQMPEMQSLLNELNQTKLPTNCPHGRPVFRKISFHELEKMFKRVV